MTASCGRVAGGVRALRSQVGDLYHRLFARYGAQGWWPLVTRAGLTGFDQRGYHPGEYRVPAEEPERFEVAVGAVLTQNTSWRNVETAIHRLLASGLLDRRSLLACREAELAEAIRPSGYFNQKARKLRILAEALSALSLPPERGQLLSLWGVGPETADSILLYAYHVPILVVDLYTRRLLRRLGWIDGREPYGAVQAMLADGLPQDPALYGEIHALIVRHAKEHCRKHPLCDGCLLLGAPCAGDSSGTTSGNPPGLDTRIEIC